MPYVTRNENGEVVAIHQNQSGESVHWEEATSVDVIEFLKQSDASAPVKHALTGSDNEMVRVIEDLVELLMEKQMFVYTELPEAVQVKLNTRKQLRKDMNSLGNLINDNDAIF